MKFSQTNLTKLEDIFKDCGYKIRYERGSFKSGSCLIQETKVVVINKFASVDTKINFLLESLKSTEIAEEELSEKSRVLYEELKQTQISF